MAKHCQNWYKSHVKMTIHFSVWEAMPPRPTALVILNPVFIFLDRPLYKVSYKKYNPLTDQSDYRITPSYNLNI